MGVVSVAISAVVGVARSDAASRAVPASAQCLVAWLRKRLTCTDELEQVLRAPHLTDAVLDLTNRLSAELAPEDLALVQELIDHIRDADDAWWREATTALTVLGGEGGAPDLARGLSAASIFSALGEQESADVVSGWTASAPGWPARPLPQVDTGAIAEYIEYVDTIRAQTHLGEAPLRTVPGAVFVDVGRESAKRRNPCFLRAAWLPILEPRTAAAPCVRRWAHPSWPAAARNALGACAWWSRFAPSATAASRGPAATVGSMVAWVPGPSRNRPPTDHRGRRTPVEWAMLAMHLMAAGVALYCCVMWAWMLSGRG